MKNEARFCGAQPRLAIAGMWTYTGEFRMTPDAPSESMTGTQENTLIYGGRFLRKLHAWTRREGIQDDGNQLHARLTKSLQK